MAHREEDSHQGGHDTGEERHHHVRGMFGKVKDTLDFTKHLGFQSGPDTLANREAIERAREREASRADHEEEEQNSSPEAGLGPGDGIAGVADTLAGIAAPKTQSTMPQTSERGAPPEKEQNRQGESIEFDKSPPHSSISKEEQKTSPAEQGREKSKGSEGGWGGWMAHKVHNLSRAVASKDLSDELLKKSKAKDAK